MDFRFSAYNILAWHCLLWDKFWLSLGLIRLKLKKKIFWSQNGSHLRDFASFEPLCVKIRQRVWLLRVPQKKNKNKNNHKTLYFTHLPRHPSWMDCHHIWHMWWTRGPNQLYQFLAIDSRVSILYGSKFDHSNWLRR